MVLATLPGVLESGIEESVMCLFATRAALEAKAAGVSAVKGDFDEFYDAKAAEDGEGEGEVGGEGDPEESSGDDDDDDEDEEDETM